MAHSASSATIQTFEYDIPAGTLSDALVRLGASSQVLLTFEPEVVRGKTTQGLKGVFTLEQGLKKLLQGTQLRYQSVGQDSVRIIADQHDASLSGEQTASDRVVDQDDMVITATRTERLLQTAPASVSVISGETLRSRPVADFSEVLQQVAGINVNQSQATGRKDIQIRGMDAQYTLILINGRRTSSSEALIRGNDFDLSTLPLNSVERIEVIRGPMSALYGSDALGGVINIITRKAQDQWQTTVSVSAETPMDGKDGETFSQSLFTSGPVNDQLSLTFALDNSNRSGWKETDDDPETDLQEKGLYLIESRDQINTRLGLDYTLDEQQSLTLDASYSDDSRFSRYESWGRESYVDQDSQRITLDLGYQVDINEQWNADVALGHESTELSDETNVYREKKSEQDNLTLNGAVTHISDLAVTVAGLELVRNQVKGNTDWVRTESVKQKAFFAQSEIDLNSDLTLTLGGRVDDHDFFGSEFSPRAYLVFNPNNALTFKGGYSEAFKAPGLFQLSKDYQVVSCGGRCYLTGNEDLQPETAKNLEASVAYQSEHWDLGLTWFRNKVDNLIERNFTDRHDVGLDMPAIYYENVSEAQFDGWELTAGSQFTPALSARFNLSSIDAENKQTGEKLTNRPDKSASLSLNWSPDDRSRYFAQIRHTGKMLNSWQIEVPSYEVLDLGGQYEIRQGWQIQAGIKNLTDERLKKDNSDYEQVQLGRSAYLSSQWQF